MHQIAEFIGAIAFATFGGFTVVSACDLLTFFLGLEIATIPMYALAAALATTCFLGGFFPPCIGIAAVDNVLNMVPGVVWFFAKIYFMVWCYMMVRWTFVRPRVDQLMDFEPWQKTRASS